jgi:signal transduction histidine kinase/CheY-like chemotaxis protein
MKMNHIYRGLVAILIVLSGFFMYRSVDAFFAMQRFDTLADGTETLASVGGLIASAENEAFEGARYFGVRGVNYLDRLSKSRKRVDRALNTLKQHIETSKTVWMDRNTIKQFAKQWGAMRSSLDKLASAYERRFEDPGVHDPIGDLLKPLMVFGNAFSGAEAERNVVTYIQSLREIKTLSDERTVLAFFLARRIRLSDKNLIVWELALEGERFEPLILHESVPASDRQTQLAWKERLDAIRGDVFEHAANTEYATQLYDLERAWSDPLQSLLHKAQEEIKSLHVRLQERTRQKQTEIIQYAFAALVLLIVLLIVYRMLRSSRREKEAMEESLKEIASDLDEGRRKELVAIMKQGDRAAVYRFLSKTTMDARAAEERALRAEKAKDLFLTNMSHEIRTPLNGILGFTQLMQSTPLNAEQEEFMGVIEGSSDNLLKIVNDILDLSKIQADKIELESIPFSLIKHLEKAIEPHAARALERGIEYSAFVDPTLPIINSDPTKLTQVITNLIGNAVKFTNEGGAVDIDARKIKESDTSVMVRFSIKDSGIGITPEQKEKIFEPFSQADISTTREFGGTGLGLTITRNIIEQMGGELDVVSEPGRGSEFFFELTFERAHDDENIQNELEGLHLAYYHSGQSTLRQMERNLALYARAAGARFRMVNDRELDMLDDVDILLLDFTDMDTQENIEKLLWQGKRTVLLSTMAHKHAVDDLSSRVERIVYRPLTASKLIRACLHANDQGDRPEAQEKGMHSVILEGMHILVAEDNPINQKLIGRVLDGMGIVSTLVSNGKEALEMRKVQKFDAILMDIQMPVMSGSESTQEILQYEYSHGIPHVPIIALTANALQGDKERYMREGFDDYISKPVNLDQLRHVLQQHCSQPEPVSSDPLSVITAPSDEKIEMDFFQLRTVVMYSRSNAVVQRIHQDALSYAGHVFLSVNSEVGLLEMIETRQPDYVLIDTYSVMLDGCDLIDAIRRSGVRLFLYGSLDPILGCNVASTELYTSVAALLKALQ